MLKINRIIAFVLCILCVFSFAGCSDFKEKINGNVSSTNESSEEKAIKTVEDFLGAVITLNADKAIKYVDNPETIYDRFNFILSADALEKSISDQMPVAGFVYKLLSPFINKIAGGVISSVQSYFKYDIVECQTSEVGYVVKVLLTVPDLSDSEYIQKQVETLYSEDSIKKIFEEMSENGKIPSNMDDINMLKSIPEIVTKLVGLAKEISFKTQSLNMDIPVFEQDGKWLIDADGIKVNN